MEQIATKYTKINDLIADVGAAKLALTNSYNTQPHTLATKQQFYREKRQQLATELQNAIEALKTEISGLIGWLEINEYSDPDHVAKRNELSQKEEELLNLTEIAVNL